MLFSCCVVQALLAGPHKGATGTLLVTEEAKVWCMRHANAMRFNVQVLLAGPHKGATGTLLAIEEAKFRARVRVHADGEPEVAAEYEDVCKIRS